MFACVSVGCRMFAESISFEEMFSSFCGDSSSRSTCFVRKAVRGFAVAVVAACAMMNDSSTGSNVLFNASHCF